MANPTRTLPTHLRNPSLAGSSHASNSPLAARIAEKKAELANLRELRDLSAQLANQMSQLEDKLRTLSDGTEAVAAVLGNWHNVLRAIHMASTKIPMPKEDGEAQAYKSNVDDTGVELPQTLVRIPAEDVQQPPEGGG